MIVFFVSDCVGKCRDFSFLLQGKLVNSGNTASTTSLHGTSLAGIFPHVTRVHTAGFFDPDLFFKSTCVSTFNY